MSLSEALTFLVALLGVGFMLLASVGIVRMPDFYTRLHAARKAHTLGIGLLLLSVAVYEGLLVVWIKMAILLVLYMLATPVTTHVLGRAASVVGTKCAPQTHLNDLADPHEPETPTAAAPPASREV